MIPTGRVSIAEDACDRLTLHAEIILGPDVFTCRVVDEYDDKWTTRPLSALLWIEWDAFPFTEEAPNEIEYLRQFIANLSPEELDAAVEAQIGLGGMDTRGEWIKAALLDMVDGRMR